jgi:hypothetical protein
VTLAALHQELGRQERRMAVWLAITVVWFAAAVVLTAGSAWLWWAHGVPFARPPHPWNAATVHLAGPWVIWFASGFLRGRL